jgi:hypothetical protein
MRPSRKRVALPLAPPPRRISKFSTATYLLVLGMRTFLMKAGGKLFCCILELLPCTRSLSEVLLTGLFACVAPFISEQPVDCLR